MTGPDRFGVVALAVASGADPNTGYDNYPVWSPDGTKISFTSLQNNDDIHMMNSDATGQTSLATNTATDFESDWQSLNTGITTQTLPFSPDWSNIGLRTTNVRIGGTRRSRPLKEIALMRRIVLLLSIAVVVVALLALPAAAQS